MKLRGKENNRRDIFYKTNPTGISLIVLVITIIVIIILATAVIVTILDNNPIASAIKAVDDSNIAKYTEQIEQVRSKLLLQSENHELPNLQQMKEALEKEKWVVETEMIMDEGVEKLKIVSKEGYIFYITEEGVEYKGKGEVVDTSALKRDDVLELVAEEETAKGQYVKITSKAEEYYVIKYKIGKEENNWTEIKSGERVEVPYGKTIYAKLFYGSSSGIEFKLKIGEINPSIVAKNIDTSNMKRKTEMVLANLFDITWGSEGSGEVEYEVTGNMLFNNTSYSNLSIENTKELELGTYNVKCTITSPNGYITDTQKQVKINQLASTSVTNDTESNINANAIYSEYDLAYFRDIVNSTNVANNAKLMENINMGNVNLTSWNTIGNNTRAYQGIFEGNNKTISNVNINSGNAMQGIFGYAENAIIKNVVLGTGSVTGANRVGCLVGYANNSTIDNVVNNGTTVTAATVYTESGINYVNNYGRNNTFGEVTDTYSLGGIVGKVENTNIQNCTNNIDIGKGNGTMVGGIVGYAKSDNEYKIYNCINNGQITKSSRMGGIVGQTSGSMIIEKCTNNGTIHASSKEWQIGGIGGSIGCKKIIDCNNTKEVTGGYYVGGIIGGLFAKSNDVYITLENSSNSAKIVCSGYVSHGYTYNGEIEELGNAIGAGGIIGYAERVKINNVNNTNVIESIVEVENASGVGGIIGELRNGDITNSYNAGEVKGQNGVGGIVGETLYNININNCYNSKNVTSKTNAGGIAGVAIQANISYCYNNSTISANSTAGGIVAYQAPFNAGDYVGNSIWYCYNMGSIAGNSTIGSIVGYINYYDTDYIYGLIGTSNSVGKGENYKGNGTHYGMLNKTDLISMVLTNYGSNFKADTSNKNNGYPILSWQ